MSPKLRVFVLLAALIVPLDQLTKWWVTRTIRFGDAVPVIDGFFSISHAVNRGIVFGFFQGGQVEIFLALTVLAMGLIVAFFRQLGPNDRLAAAALGLILGGAVGNGIDRVFRPGVVDFLRFDLGLFVYPDFNVADSGIVIGVGLLLLSPQALQGSEPAPGASPQGDST